MSTSELDQIDIPRVRFTQRERRGVLLGRTGPQVIVVAATIACFVLATLVFSWDVTGYLLIPAGLLIALAVWNFRGEPVLTLISRAVTFRNRAAAGQTRYRRDVWKEAPHTALPAGEAPERIPQPEVFRTLRLPGGLADVTYVDIPGRGGFLYNAKEKLASVTVRVDAPAWALRDDARKSAIHDDFGSWLSSLEGMAGLTEADLRVRVDRAPSTELSDYAARQDDANRPEISDELRATYDWLVATEQARSMEFTNTLTFTIDVRKINKDVRDSGGGLGGLAAILSDHVDGLVVALPDIGVSFAGWLSASELEAYISSALDPVSASFRRERLGRGADESDSRPPLMAIDEQWSSVRVNESEHRTLWIHEWPRTEVRTGFLRPLLYSGESSRCLVIKFRPVPLEQALNDVASAKTDLDAAEHLREKLGTSSNVFHKREVADLEEREEDLGDGFSDARFRAFITISASTVTDVRRDQTSLEGAGFKSRVRMGVLYSQQWAALVNAVLPVPVRDRRAK